MGYDRGDSLPLDFELNGIPFGSKSKGKLSPRPYPIQYQRKLKYSFLSVHHCVPHTKRNFFSDSFQSEWNRFIVKVFLLIMYPTKFRWVHNRKKNCYYNRIPIVVTEKKNCNYDHRYNFPFEYEPTGIPLCA